MTANKSPGKLGRGPDAPTNVAPQIIRTRDELAALDPDTVLMSTDLFDPLTFVWDWLDGEGTPARGTENGLPAVVISTGDQIRAAQQALKEEE